MADSYDQYVNDDDYSELNDVEFSLANMPLDSFTDYDKEMALANYHKSVELARYRCVGVDEFGYSRYVLENDLGKLEVRGDSRVFVSKKKEC